MQSKRLVIFIIICVAYMFIFFMIQNALFPPTNQLTDQGKKLVAQRTFKVGIGNDPWALLAVECALNPPKKEEKQELSPFERRQIQDVFVGMNFGGNPFARINFPQVAAEVRAKERAKKHPPIVIGSEDRSSPFHLGVTLNARGAGVKKLVLNAYEDATLEGKPGGKRFVLIPEKTTYGKPTRPSFVVYHFDSLKNSKQPPLDSLEHRIWEVVNEEKSESVHTVTFATTVLGVRITKTFTLKAGEPHLSLEVKLKRVTRSPTGETKFRYQLAGAHNLPIEGRWYTDTFRQAMIGYTEEDDFKRNYQDTRRLRQESVAIDRDTGRIPRYAAVAVQYFASAIAVDDPEADFLASARPTLEERVIRITLKDRLLPGQGSIKIQNPKDRDNPEVTLYFAPGVVRQQYPTGTKLGFLSEFDGQGRLRVRNILEESQIQPVFYDDLTVRLNTQDIDLPEGGKEVVHKYLLYNGPIKVRLAGSKKDVDSALLDKYIDGMHLNTMTDYHTPGGLGKFANAIFLTDLIIFFTNIMHTVLGWLINIIGIHGICIIVLTVIVRGMMFPMSKKQVLTSIKMQELAPELKKLNEQHKDNPQEKMQAMMALYRKHGVSPLGSCWVLLLQLPIFMGLYWALRESVQFRLSSFLWIDNLSAPDMLFRWGEGIPIISRPGDYGSILYLGPYFNLLPILAIIFMLIQQQMMMPPPADEQQAAQRKMMKFMMIFFAILFYKVAAGLCIYFIASSLWGFAERKLLPKKDDKGGMAGKPVKADDPVIRSEKKVEKPAAKDKKGTFGGKGKKDRALRKGQRGVKKGTPVAQKTEEKSEGGGFWKRISDWWSDVLDRAKKKG